MKKFRDSISINVDVDVDITEYLTDVHPSFLVEAINYNLKKLTGQKKRKYQTLIREAHAEYHNLSTKDIFESVRSVLCLSLSEEIRLKELLETNKFI